MAVTVTKSLLKSRGDSWLISSDIASLLNLFSSFRRLGHDNAGPVLNITYGEEMEDGTWKMVICINKTTRTRCMPAILAPGKWRVSTDIILAVKFTPLKV